MSPGPVDIEVKGETDTTSVVVPEPLTVDDVTAWRAKGSVPTGTAAASNSDMFKSPVRPSFPLILRFEMGDFMRRIACLLPLTISHFSL